VEVARISGESIVPCKKAQTVSGTYDKIEMVDDMRLLKLNFEGKTILVLYVSAAENITVERVSE
jgi:hypothetical protein